MRACPHDASGPFNLPDQDGAARVAVARKSRKGSLERTREQSHQRDEPDRPCTPDLEGVDPERDHVRPGRKRDRPKGDLQISQIAIGEGCAERAEGFGHAADNIPADLGGREPNVQSSPRRKIRLPFFVWVPDEARHWTATDRESREDGASREGEAPLGPHSGHIGSAVTRRAIRLAALVLGCLALAPAAAQAQYPYDWHAATPPSWFTESTDSSCQITEYYYETINVPPGQSWNLLWESSPRSVCFKPLPLSPELGPDVALYCNGSVGYFHRNGFPDAYTAVWKCSVGTETRAVCTRNSHYEESPLGNPNEAYNFDSGGWYSPSTLEPYDCRPSESGDDEGTGGSDCDRAKKKVKKAKQKLQEADTAGEKAAAREKLKKAKQKKKEACG